VLNHTTICHAGQPQQPGANIRPKQRLSTASARSTNPPGLHQIVPIPAEHLSTVRARVSFLPAFAVFSDDNAVDRRICFTHQ